MNERCVICNYFSSEYGIRSRKFHYVEGDCICSDCYSSVASCLKDFIPEEDKNKEEIIEQHNLFERELPCITESNRDFPSEEGTSEDAVFKQRKDILENSG